MPPVGQAIYEWWHEMGVTIHSSSNFFLSDGRGRYRGRSDGPDPVKPPDPMARNPKSLWCGLRSFYSYFWMAGWINIAMAMSHTVAEAEEQEEDGAHRRRL